MSALRFHFSQVFSVVMKPGWNTWCPEEWKPPGDPSPRPDSPLPREPGLFAQEDFCADCLFHREWCFLSTKVFFWCCILFCFVFSLGEMREQQARAGGNKGCKVSLVACPLSGRVLGRELKRPKGKFRAGPSLLSALEGSGSTQLFCLTPAQATQVIGLEAPWKYLCTWWSLAAA